MLLDESGTLYGNVASGTAFAIRGGGDRAALQNRRKEIRDIIANWSVLLEETRELLEQLKHAVDNRNSLEVRLRNLQDDALPVHVGFEVLKNQINALGTAGALQ